MWGPVGRARCLGIQLFKDQNIERGKFHFGQFFQQSLGHPLIRPTQVFAHEGLIPLQAMFYKDSCNLPGGMLIIREDPDLGVGSYLLNNGLNGPSMDAHQDGILPTFLGTREGKLHGADGGQDFEVFLIQLVHKILRNTIKIRVPRGQDHHPFGPQVAFDKVRDLLEVGFDRDFLAL
jgi:hypothetical protein